MLISWNAVIFNTFLLFPLGLRQFFIDRWARNLCREKPSKMVFCGSPLIHVSFVATDQWASPKRRMEDFSRQNSSLIGHKNQAKFENDRIARSGHRFKITQPNLMILVSFSSAEDALSNNLNKYKFFSSQGTEHPPFRFFWDTRYTCSWSVWTLIDFDAVDFNEYCSF